VQFKIDENLPVELAMLLRTASHDAMTVGQQGLNGKADNEIFSVCVREGRALITCDRDFENTKLYPSSASPGIIVLRVEQSIGAILAIARGILPFLHEGNVRGRTWIVGESSLRIK